MNCSSDLDRAIDGIMRQDRGRLLATLIANLKNFDLAEDVLSDALESALIHWARNGIPQNPVGWLLKVARRKAIDRLRREMRFRARQGDIARLAAADELDANMPNPEIPDERLRLIFTCCHPALDPKSRVALTLRTIGGLTTAEIASAFLDAEKTMGQRITRAKSKIAKSGIPFSIPETDLWDERLSSVLAVIYLIFNEGYSASSGESAIRAELCDEALFLVELLNELQPDEPEIEGLLALLSTIHGRRLARRAVTGASIPLAQQDRSKWNHKMIGFGVRTLNKAVSRGRSGPFQIKAAISVLHCSPLRNGATDWPQIVLLYDSLLRFEPTSVVRLNRAVALAEAGGLDQALTELLALADELSDYQPLHAAQAEYFKRAGRPDDAFLSYDRAIALARNAADRQYLEQQKREIS